MDIEEDNTDILVETLPLLGVCNLCLNDGVVKSMLIKQKHDGLVETYLEMILWCFSIDMLTVELEDTKRLICNSCITKLIDCIQFREKVLDSLKTLKETALLKEQKEKEKKTLAVKDILQFEPDDDSDNNHADDDIPLADVKDEVLVADLLWDGEATNKSKDKTDAMSAIKQEYEEIEGNITEQRQKGKKTLGVKDIVQFEPDDDSNNCAGKTDTVSAIKEEYDEIEGNITDVTDDLNDKDLEDYQPKKTRRKTLSSTKKRVSFSVKKKLDTSETEKMLQAGLFPFKMYKDRTYSCVICTERSNSLEDIRKHVTNHSTQHLHHAFKKLNSSKLQRFIKSASNLRCKLCKTDISDFEQLSKHLDSCSRLSSNRWSGLPFKLEKGQLDCPVCGRSFLNFVNLNTHMNVHYPNHVCDSCGKSFASQARLRGHMRTHELGSFPCRYCGAVFDRVTKRENHVSKEHKAGLRYACKRCNISLSSFYTRQKHLAEVHNEELKRYKCNACTQSYITPGHLSSHVRRDHLNERNHQCDKCDLAFYTRNALKMHMIRHDGERIHSCHICHKSYQRLKTLREHLRIHNNDKRFVCPVCGRAFTQKCTLKGHLKVHDRRTEGEVECPRSLVICRLEPMKE